MITQRALREACLRDFFTFVRAVNPPPKNAAPISRAIHRRLCEAYQRCEDNRIAITMPRDWLKSTIFTCWGPIWLYLKDNEERILIACENVNLAGRFLKKIERQILMNKNLRKIFPELLAVDKAYTKSPENQWSASECLLPRVGNYTEPTFTAIGVGGAAQSGHYTTIQIDDLVGKKAAESALVLESTWRWIDNVNELLVQPFREMPNPSKIFIIGTFWFPGDFLCYVQEKYKDYHYYITPCRRQIADVDDGPKVTWVQNPTVEPDESNWPEQFPTQYYIEMLQNPEKELIYWAQHMNMPRKSGAFVKFDVKWLRYYHIEKDKNIEYIVFEKEDGTEMDRIPERSVLWRGIFDPGGFSPEKIKLTKGSSRNAALIGGQQVGSERKIVRGVWVERFREPDRMLKALFKMHQEIRPIMWRQEIYGQQRYILEDVKKYSRKEGIPITIVELESDMTKDQKDLAIQALINPMANGEIWIQRNMFPLIAEVQTYPNGVTKDLLDCLAQLMKHYWRRGVREDYSHLNRRNTVGSSDSAPSSSPNSMGY
jgi:hypothetical protein